jgi:ubiquinone/menaquinone biosynthesis C-methylase UbiE
MRLFLITLLAFAAPLLQADPKPSPLYETRPDHDPNGTGKFFLGREIAHVMGHQGAAWLERPEREEEEATDRLLDALDLKPGMTVADIGAGSGFFSWRMARKVTPEGRIYAVDIQQEMLDLLMKNMAKRRVDSSVTPILGTVTDPKLPPQSCDLMLLVDVYHEFDHPYEMVAHMVPALKPGGRLVLVEYRLEDPNVPIKLVHKMSEAQARREITLHSELQFLETKTVLPQQHILVFVRK